MKKSQEIIGLPVFSIVEGRKIGQVKDLVINPEEGRVEFILVSNGSWYVGARVLPYKAVMGVGEHAVTTESENLMAMINETSSANSLLQRNIEVKGNRLLTNKGNLIGVISEYQIDEVSGKIVSLEYKSALNENQIDIVLADDVLTYGADVIVIKERAPQPDLPPTPQTVFPEMEASLSQFDTGLDKPIPVQVSSSEVQAPTSEVPQDAASLFKDRQRQFLLGKKVIQDIRDARGSVLIKAGTIITEEIFNLADKQGKFIELSELSK